MVTPSIKQRYEAGVINLFLTKLAKIQTKRTETLDAGPFYLHQLIPTVMGHEAKAFRIPSPEAAAHIAADLV